MVTRSPRARKTAPPMPAVKPFVLESDTYKITFEGAVDGRPAHPLHGVEIEAREIWQGPFEALMMAWGKATERNITMAERSTRLTVLREQLGERLISWNLTRPDGTPVPANADGLAEIRREHFWSILGAYAEAASGVSGPLDDDSDDGSSSEVPSVPMDDL